MRTSRSGGTLAIALLAAFGVGRPTHAAQSPMAVPPGATVRESQDATLADANARAAAAAARQAPRASVGATPVATDAANYVPKTQYDNTPYRFNAGKRFTAAEFDAWMKSRGIRVAKGVPAAAASTGGARQAAPAAGAEAARGCGTGADPTAC